MSVDIQPQPAVPPQSAVLVPQPSKGMPPELLYQLMKDVLDGPYTPNQKKELIDEIRKSSGMDRWSSRTAIWMLGLIVPCSLISLIVLNAANKDITGVVAIGSTAVGGLAGLLAPTKD
ncbi:hypothetical protein ACQZ32_07080 [Ralstonia pseudosolanacearum]|uniref:hypothetical protein n=1 Tax=Ralstonia pseudosolanacearum TaxID=1310165 RepID=UPI0009BF6599|nr:hypothetical protein [Ralstonia pseudosolanacearum]MDC6293787.1 hypothetical protein [Ralstonia pseudosolanacearum]MDD7788674.1 hypothetical protein [Ralstonia pseudosolanacearum]MDN3366506.1 hypothetical protein [Ralstonia pseudosolanacearum]QOK89823.1 hypothetical protein HF907_25220 [Ralstonia pseudosolanacearum]